MLALVQQLPYVLMRRNIIFLFTKKLRSILTNGVNEKIAPSFLHSARFGVEKMVLNK